MFDFVRKHKRIMQFLLFLLIVPSFVLFGLDGYNRFREKSPVVARVGDVEITQAQWDQAHKLEVDRARQAMPNLDLGLLESPRARYATLERLVQDRLLEAAARRWHLSVGDAKLALELQSNPVIAGLRGPDGKLDVDRYRQLLASQGVTPEVFEAQVRAELSAQQVVRAVSESQLMVPQLADVALAALFERREIELARFAPKSFRDGLKPTEDELKAYFEAHPQRFQAPERIDVEYVVLDVDTVRQSVSVSDAEVEDYYRQNAARYATPEERRASHILIAVDSGAGAAAREQAKAKANEIREQLRQNPARFAELARQVSQDPGSAANGGDLGFFARGAMVKPFEDAVFSLKKGEISDVVETEFGYHIITVTDVRGGQQKSLAEVRAQIVDELKKTLAQRRFAELAESFSNAVYEQSESLKPVAERFKLRLEVAQGVERKPKPGEAGVLADPKFLAALFSAESIEKKRNTEAIELGPNRLVAGRVLRHEPAHTRPYAEVRDQVKELWLEERSVALAKAEGEKRLREWKSTPASAVLPERLTVGRDQTAGLPGAVIDAVLRAPRSNLPALVGVDLGAQGYVVVRVKSVLPATEVPEAMRQKSRQAWAEAWTGAEVQAYLSSLKAAFGVKILVPEPSKEAEGG